MRTIQTTTRGQRLAPLIAPSGPVLASDHLHKVRWGDEALPSSELTETTNIDLKIFRAEASVLARRRLRRTNQLPAFRVGLHQLFC